MNRLDYQRNWACGFTLNVGCGDNPGNVGDVQLDIDVWSHNNFIWGDAHHLPFKDLCFDSVIIGDTLEHVIYPDQVLREAKRVTRGRIIITVPQEAIPHKLGQYIDEGKKLFWAEAPHPKRIHKFKESIMSHGPAINSFSHEMISKLIKPLDMITLDWQFVPECDWMNWLICLGRKECHDTNQ